MSDRKRKKPDSGASPACASPPEKLPKLEEESLEELGPSRYTLPLTVSPTERPPAFGRPQQLTCFSYDLKRQLHFDTSALKFYVPAPINADLGYRYENWVKRPEERGRIDSLLHAVEQECVVGERKKGAFVTWRGVVTKLMIAPIETRDSVELNIMLLDGCVYAEEHSDDAKLAEKETMAPRHRRMTYYGYSFESFSTWVEPLVGKEQHAERDRARCWSGDVDTNVQFCSVVKTKIDTERIILGGEVDCCRDRYTGQPDTYVELKTSIAIRNPQDEQRFERKLLKFWAQSFLLGVPEIVVGFRTHQGQISTIQSFQTMGLPRMVRGKPGAWDPNTCLVFIGKLLRFIRMTLEADDRKSREDTAGVVAEERSAESEKAGDRVETRPAVWRLSIPPNARNVTLRKLDQEEVEVVRNGEDRVGFLPTWFYNSVMSVHSERSPVPNQ
ncbi:nuclear 5'-3' exoribonuclease-interacting protein, Rai1p [Ceratobasidium sp. AG-Ba]|nr:nuclear 5'-3' exoribonuclease-interacting protein, Rai1p [Ceratobasidium sp. AG-Ba]